MNVARYETAQTSLLGNRQINQDRAVVVRAQDSVFIAVADGMGGHPRGEVAAQILTDTFRSAYLNVKKPVANPGKWIEETLARAHREIVDFGIRQKPPIAPRTTGVICLIQDHTAVWAHVGDSRLYVYREGRIIAQTEDHSYVQELCDNGLLATTEAASHPFKNFVTRCIGGSNKLPQITQGEPMALENGDIILLCSDGLWGVMEEHPLSEALFDPVPLASSVSNMVHRAESLAFPTSDNVTAAAIKWLSDPPENIGTAAADASKDADGRKRRQEMEKALSELQAAMSDLERGLSKLDKSKTPPKTPED